MTKQNDSELIDNLIHWENLGSIRTNHKELEPELQNAFLRLEKLGIAYVLDIKDNWFTWRIDFDKAKKLAKQLMEPIK